MLHSPTNQLFSLMKSPVSKPIPHPPIYPIVKSVLSLDIKRPVQSMMALAEKYGGIYRLEVPNDSLVIVSGLEYVQEFCDESRFDKKVFSALEKVRDLTGDGLFTAHTEEPNWGKAHRILTPAFGPHAMQDMFDKMYDVAEQLCVKLQRLGPDEPFNVPANMTRLTLDTIALCAFDYRFNSFYKNEMHPFVEAMLFILHEANQHMRRLPIMNRLMYKTKERYNKDIQYMYTVAHKILEQRRKAEEAEQVDDLLGRMLEGVDPETGEKLSDQNIIYQMVTFLIAGHETTSSMMAFTFYEMLKQPHILARVQAEVDEVVGQEKLQFHHLSQLKYMDMVIKECLRLWPIASGFNLRSFKDEQVGEYLIKPTDSIFIFLPSLHRAPIWGEDPKLFNPENFSPENEAKIPHSAYLPFGNGRRSCIGRPFAFQEAKLAIAMILQRFDISLADPNYELVLDETLTLKPDNYFLKFKKRPGFKPVENGPKVPASQSLKLKGGKQIYVQNKPLLYLAYGSNMGSSKKFIQQLAETAKVLGYQPSVHSLNEAKALMAQNKGHYVIITASYEGQPTHDAEDFVDWIMEQPEGSLNQVQYSLFGCGNSDWIHSYQAVPRKIDAQLKRLGAQPFLARGEGNAKQNFFASFNQWHDELWPALAKSLGQDAISPIKKKSYKVQLLHDWHAQTLGENDFVRAQLLSKKELVQQDSPFASSKIELQIEVPEGQSYQTGGYIDILPQNSPATIQRVLRHFQMQHDPYVKLESEEQSVALKLPLDQHIRLTDLLKYYVELQRPAGKKWLEEVLAQTRCPFSAQGLQQFIDQYESEVLQKNRSLLSIIEQFPGAKIDLGQFIRALPAMRPRTYSISSSVKQSADKASLVISCIKGAAWSGQGEYQGLASGYLSQLEEGQLLWLRFTPNLPNFPAPKSEDKLILIAAGTGIAPFRAFMQERSLEKNPEKAVFFYGCRAKEVDQLYAEEFAQWEKEGWLDLRPVYSKAPEKEGQTYVQHRLWADRDAFWAAWKAGAKIYICGDGEGMAPAVRQCLMDIYQEKAQATEAQALDWLMQIAGKDKRYFTDIFS